MTPFPDPHLAAIRRLVAPLPALIIGLEPGGRVLLWNRQAEALLGCPADKAIGRCLTRCPAAWDTARIAAGLEGCRPSAEAVRLDGVRCVRSGGATVELGLTLIPLGEEGLFGLDILIAGADVSERRQLEEELARARKMQAIGHLAAGIAHEISTPAQFVGDNTHFLKDAFADYHQLLVRYGELAAAVRDGRPTAAAMAAVDAAAAELDPAYLAAEVPLAVAHILDGVRRISKIVRSMKFFAHPGTGVEKDLLDLNQAIESTIVISRNEWKYVAEIETDLDRGLPPVPGRRGEINQVLLNLVTNAAHAVVEKQGNGSAVKGCIHIASGCRDGWAEIRIQDSGAGIPEAVRPKIFDLFFTTKEQGRGSGQGLAIAHSVIVDQHGGELTFETEPGKGTTFIVRLPIGGGGRP